MEPTRFCLFFSTLSLPLSFFHVGEDLTLQSNLQGVERVTAGGLPPLYSEPTIQKETKTLVEGSD
jgi:hypothetical protein